MVATRPRISKSSSPCTSPLLAARSLPIIFMFHSFFSSLARSRYLYLFSLSFRFTLGQPERQSPLSSRFIFFFLFTITKYGRLGEIKRSVCTSIHIIIIIITIIIIIITPIPIDILYSLTSSTV